MPIKVGEIYRFGLPTDDFVIYFLVCSLASPTQTFVAQMGKFTKQCIINEFPISTIETGTLVTDTAEVASVKKESQEFSTLLKAGIGV